MEVTWKPEDLRFGRIVYHPRVVNETYRLVYSLGKNSFFAICSQEDGMVMLNHTKTRDHKADEIAFCKKLTKAGYIPIELKGGGRE